MSRATPEREDRTPDGEVATPGMRTFLVIWLGQLISAMGTGLGSFALGVWVFEQRRSVVQLSLLAAAGGLTALAMGPFAGILADRRNRRRLMILCNLGSATAVLLIALLLHLGLLRPWHAYPVNAVMTAFGILLGPSYLASVSLLVPREKLSRAAGMSQAAAALAQIAGPPLAGALVPRIGFAGVITIDCATFLFAAATLLASRLPQPIVVRRAATSFVSDLGEAFRFITTRPGFNALLGLFALTNFSLGMVQVLLTPLVLAIAPTRSLATVSSVSAVGTLLGALLLSLWKGPRRKVMGIYAALLAQGTTLILGGMRPSIPWIAANAFVFMLAAPIVYGCSQVIWQRKVAPEVQGRVFAIRQVIASASLPLAYLAAGPLADRIFEPSLRAGGALATSVGLLVGVGPGRGVGFLFMALGGLILAVTFASFANPRLRRLESELPDALPVREPEQVPPPALSSPLETT